MAATDERNNPEGWTFATLYKHVMALSDASKEAAKSAMDAAKEASDKADKATEKRFDSVNEFRNALKDQQSTFADKEQTERRLNNLEVMMASKAGQQQGVGFSAGVIVQLLISAAALATVIGFVVTRSH